MGKKYITLFSIFLLILYLSGCTSENSTNSSNNEASNTVTLIHSIQMFDFSRAKYITEHGDNEDIDVLLITDNGDARLYAYNGAEIKKQQDAVYLTVIDVSVGTICNLIDNDGGTATFNITEITQTEDEIPSVTFTYEYMS